MPGEFPRLAQLRDPAACGGMAFRAAARTFSIPALLFRDKKPSTASAMSVSQERRISPSERDLHNPMDRCFFERGQD